jgi:phage I-like protein
VVEGFEEAATTDEEAEAEGNSATTDALWKDGSTNGGDRVPEGGDGSRVTGTASNAVSVTPDADGWYQIAPYGEFPTNDGKYIQVFGPDQARAMVKHFNSLPFKITRWLFNKEVPVFIGHPDVDRREWKDERKLAVKHLALEAREDGLWGQAAWNDLGRDNLANGFWQYPSPVWLFPKPKAGTKRVFPDLLQSVGLTNFQNIPDARRVTANADAGTTQPTEDDMIDPQLLAALCLDETATIEQVLEKIAAMKEAAKRYDWDGETWAMQTILLAQTIERSGHDPKVIAALAAGYREAPALLKEVA